MEYAIEVLQEREDAIKEEMEILEPRFMEEEIGVMKWELAELQQAIDILSSKVIAEGEVAKTPNLIGY